MIVVFCVIKLFCALASSDSVERVFSLGGLLTELGCLTRYPRESFREALCNHRRAFVCLSVCLFVCLFVTTITK